MWPAKGDEVKEFFRLPWVIKSSNDKGHACEACGRLLKIYHRRLTALTVAGVIRLHLLMQKHPDEKYHHVRSLGVSLNGGEFAQARRWGFTEEAPKDKDKDTRTSGMWTLTPRGLYFLTRKMSVPQYAVLRWGSEHIGFSGDLIDVRAAVEYKNKFSYDELMNGNAPPRTT